MQFFIIICHSNLIVRIGIQAPLTHYFLRLVFVIGNGMAVGTPFFDGHHSSLSRIYQERAVSEAER